MSTRFRLRRLRHNLPTFPRPAPRCRFRPNPASRRLPPASRRSLQCPLVLSHPGGTPDLAAAARPVPERPPGTRATSRPREATRPVAARGTTRAARPGRLAQATGAPFSTSAIRARCPTAAARTTPHRRQADSIAVAVVGVGDRNRIGRWRRRRPPSTPRRSP